MRHEFSKLAGVTSTSDVWAVVKQETVIRCTARPTREGVNRIARLGFKDTDENVRPPVA